MLYTYLIQNLVHVGMNACFRTFKGFSLQIKKILNILCGMESNLKKAFLDRNYLKNKAFDRGSHW